MPPGKNLPAMQETQVQSLVWEDPLEKGMVRMPPSIAVNKGCYSHQAGTLQTP